MGKINKKMLKYFQIVLKKGGRISKSDVAKAFVLDNARSGESQIVSEFHFENLGRPGQAKNYTDLEKKYVAKDKKKFPKSKLPMKDGCQASY